MTYSRREILRGAAGVLVASAVGCKGARKDPDKRPSGGGPTQSPKRVAIVGGGTGGIAAAYFLDAACDVELFEAAPKIGGHCDSRVVEYGGRQVTVDVGAQFFHPKTHPIYVTLLEKLGLFDPKNPAADETFEADGSLCVFPLGGGKPAFTSTDPLSAPAHSFNFARYAKIARSAVLGNLPWDTTMSSWISELPTSAAFNREVLYPWLTALAGTTRSNLDRMSARSVLQLFALSFPENIADGATTYNSKLGLQGNLRRLLELAPRTKVLLGSAATALAYEDGKWFVRTATEQRGPYQAVVMNAPPRISRELLRPLSWAGNLVELLDKYEYFDARVLIHSDPAYVHRDRKNWAAYNAGVTGAEAEGSAWVGALHDPMPDGSRVDLFKSWAKRRRSEPTTILAEREFQHPLITPSVIGAAKKLSTLQGKNDLYFGGHYTTGMDLQESALYSAMNVAARLASDSPTLAALKTELDARGLGKISYDL